MQRKREGQNKGGSRRKRRIMTLSPILDKEKGRKEKRQINEEQFVQLFQLFFRAVSHELSTSFGALLKILYRKKQEELPTADKLTDSYNRLKMIQNLMGENADVLGGEINRCSYFSLEEKKKLKLLHVIEHPRRISELKKMALEEVGELKKLLLHIEDIFDKSDECSEDKDAPYVRRAIKVGKFLSRSLEEVMEGGIYLDDSLIDKRIGDREGLNGVGEWFSIVSKFVECDISITHEDEEISEKGVKVNPIFSILILLNVFSNAKRAMEAKGVEPQMAVRVSQKDSVAVFEVSDCGCGMDGNSVEKLNSGTEFTTKDGGEAHGRGFKLCRELAASMEGKLYVKESRRGVGTTVALELGMCSEQPL